MGDVDFQGISAAQLIESINLDCTSKSNSHYKSVGHAGEDRMVCSTAVHVMASSGSVKRAACTAKTDSSTKCNSK